MKITLIGTGNVAYHIGLRLKEKGVSDVLLTGGGIIPDDDMKKLSEMGVGKLFPPGTDTSEIVEYITNWVATNRNF